MRTSSQTSSTLDLRSLRGSVGLARAHVLDLQQASPSLHEVPVQEVREPSVQEGRVLRSRMLYVLSIALFVGTSWHMLPSLAYSLAYFTDTEAAPARMDTGILDLKVIDPHDTQIGCGGSADVVLPVEVEAHGFGSMVAASTTALTGNDAFCAGLDLEVHYVSATNTRTIYSGHPSMFTAEGIGTGTLRFNASLPGTLSLTDSVTCTMQLGFDAWLAPYLQVESGFSDHEDTQVTFSVIPGSCPGDCSAPGPCSGCGGNTTIVTHNTNVATVTNAIVVTANTGGNSANGGTGSSTGGTIVTGNTSSNVVITNIVNSNTTTVTTGGGCGCGTGCPCESGAPVSSDPAVQHSLVIPQTPAPGIRSAQEILTQVQNQLKQQSSSRRR